MKHTRPQTHDVWYINLDEARGSTVCARCHLVPCRQRTQAEGLNNREGGAEQQTHSSSCDHTKSQQPKTNMSNNKDILNRIDVLGEGEGERKHFGPFSHVHIIGWDMSDQCHLLYCQGVNVVCLLSSWIAFYFLRLTRVASSLSC